MGDDRSDDLAGGRGFLRDMSDQSRRARAFDRRLEWARLRHLIAAEPDAVPPELVVLPDADQAVVDLTASAEPAVPRQRG
jgi:hypothetical protein